MSNAQTLCFVCISSHANNLEIKKLKKKLVSCMNWPLVVLMCQELCSVYNPSMKRVYRLEKQTNAAEIYTVAI